MSFRDVSPKRVRTAVVHEVEERDLESAAPPITTTSDGEDLKAENEDDAPPFGGAFTPTVPSLARSMRKTRASSANRSTASQSQNQSVGGFSQPRMSTTSGVSSSRRSGLTRRKSKSKKGNESVTDTSHGSIDLKDPNAVKVCAKGNGIMGERPVPLWALMIIVNVFCVALVAVGVATSGSVLSRQSVDNVASQLRLAFLRQVASVVLEAVLDVEGAANTLSTNTAMTDLIRSSAGRTDLRSVYLNSVAATYEAMREQSPQMASISFVTRFPTFMGLFSVGDAATSTYLIQDASSPDGHYYFQNGTLAKTLTNFKPTLRPYYVDMIQANYQETWGIAYQSQSFFIDILMPFVVPIQTAVSTGNITADTIGLIYISLSTTSLRNTLLTIQRTPNTVFAVIEIATSRVLASTLPVTDTINTTTSATGTTVSRIGYSFPDCKSPFCVAGGRQLASKEFTDWIVAYGAVAGSVYDATIRVDGYGAVDMSCTAVSGQRAQLALAIIVMTPQSDYLQVVKRADKISIILVILITFVGAALAALAGVLVSRPLIRLTRLMKRVQRMELSRGSDSHASLENMSGVKEVRNLENGFDAMVLGLKSFEKFVPSSLVQRLLRSSNGAELEVHRREITIFFSDIADFTTIAESMKPKNLILLLAEYLTEMSNIIQRSDGTVGEFIGDAIMGFWVMALTTHVINHRFFPILDILQNQLHLTCSFSHRPHVQNSPDEVSDHASFACGAALEQLYVLDTDLNKRWRSNGWPHISIRCGINTGTVLHGIIGSRSRMKWGLVGDSVNLASRLEALCKRYRVSVCISDSTLALLRSEEWWIFPMDVVAVKGKGRSTKLYELAGERGGGGDVGLAEKHAAWMKVWDAYTKRDWTMAGRELTAFSAAFGGYGPAMALRDRLEEFEKLPPPDDWSGVTVLHDK
ncbi:hypothetical protein HKX48_007072 [Thoreauomyces humboldtii]|nr:hypothetical protein HKX48_007072 [Thoreauomyces humboldtii]